MDIAVRKIGKGSVVEIATPYGMVRIPRKRLNDLIRMLLKELNAGAAPELVGAEPLVLYFGNDKDRDGMIAACKSLFKNLKTIKV